MPTTDCKERRGPSIKDGKYNVETGLPVTIRLPDLFYPKYTMHARREADNDRYGPIELPQVFDMRPFRIVELEFQAGRPVRMLVRGPLAGSNTKDLCMVIDIKGNVVTLWINLRSDTHRTLNKSRIQSVA